MIKYITPLILLAGLVFGRAQAQMPTGQEYQDDWLLLQTTLDHNYPYSYRYASKEEVYHAFALFQSKLWAGTGDLEFYKELKRTLSSLKDGHLHCTPSPALETYFSKKATYFPCHITFFKGRAFVLSSVKRIIPAVSEITAINGESMAEIREKLHRYIVADGNIETKKDHILSNNFAFYYLLEYGEQKAFNITYVPEEALKRTIVAKPVSESRLKKYKIKQKRKAQPLLKLHFESNVAVLTIGTFDRSKLQRQKLDFEKFLEESFAEIKRKETVRIIIDLRGNGGGRDLYGSLLYAYLTDKPFRYYKSLAAATNKLPYDQLTSAVSSYNNLSPGMLKVAVQGYTLTEAAHPNLGLIQPAKNNYSGKVWILTDGLTFSTAAEVCAIARSEGRAEFIGEETGGTYEGNISGVMQELLLPHSGITVSYGAIRYDMDVKPAEIPGRGIIPDMPVMPWVKYILQGDDVQLRQAISFVKDR